MFRAFLRPAAAIFRAPLLPCGFVAASAPLLSPVPSPVLFRSVLVLGVMLAGCSPFSLDPIPGPDKQFVGTVAGAGVGAGTGAVIGAQVGAGTGPGAWVGAGFGAIYGMVSGLGMDMLEEDQLRRDEEEQRLRELAWVQEVLTEHYARRLELHPQRDIFPADWFFENDGSELKGSSVVLAHELGALTLKRMPWSRIVVASYVTTQDKDSHYAQYVTKRRAEQIANEFIRAGVEPRRVMIKGVAVDEPILIDPDDSPSRYRQAIEIIPLDR